MHHFQPRKSKRPEPQETWDHTRTDAHLCSHAFEAARQRESQPHAVVQCRYSLRQKANSGVSLPPRLKPQHSTSSSILNSRLEPIAPEVERRSLLGIVTMTVVDRRNSRLDVIQDLRHD